MSFTSDIKKEIIHSGLHTDEERKAALSAFVRTSGFVGEKDGVPSFFIVSETENVAEFFMAAFLETFNVELSVTHATMDRMSGRDKLLLQCPAARAESVLQQLYLLESVGIDEQLLGSETEMIAYVKGALAAVALCQAKAEKRAIIWKLYFPIKTSRKIFVDCWKNWKCLYILSIVRIPLLRISRVKR